MKTIYVDPRAGDDIHGDGSSGRAFKTIAKAVTLLDHGDTIVVADAYTGNFDDYVFNEPSTIELIGYLNVNLRFLKTPGQTHTHTVWKPTLVDPVRRASLYIEGCSNIKIDGATFTSQSPLGDHAFAVRVVNSNDVTLSSCKIHRTWQVDNSPSGELFSASGSNATFSDLSFDSLENSYSNQCSFIAISGSGEYKLYSNSIQNLRSNNGIFRGIWVKDDVRKVTIDGFLAHNIASDLVDHAIGIDIESDASQVEFVVNSGQFSNTHIGIRLTNIPNGLLSKQIKHCTFYKCRKSLETNNSKAEFYSCSSHGPGLSWAHEYPPGHTQLYTTYGIYADNNSYIDTLNCIFTYMHTPMYAQNNSRIIAQHLVWNDCTLLKEFNNNSSVETVQFVRRVAPRYFNLSAFPYGNFSLDDDSPCIDTGKKYGDAFLGLAPDIGALERSKKIRIDDLPALLARTARYATKIPLTNIDIQGMIVQGLDTYDPEVQAGREGSAVKDIAVKPLTGLINPYHTELEFIRDNMSILNADTMTDEAMDALAANLYVIRKNGDVSTGVIRIYFESPIATVIPAESNFIAQGNLSFFSLQEVSISAEEMALNYDNGLYYVDILAEAEGEGAQYNVDVGAITRATTPMPSGVVAIVNPNTFSGGANQETNLELKERIKYAITVRDLVTKKGIIFTLPDTFTFIREILPVGFRDVEMLRDEILGYHIGGKVDIYIRTSALATDSKIIELVNSVNKLDLATFGNVPIVSIQSIEVLDPATLDSTDIFLPSNAYSVRVNNPKTTFSIYEDNDLLVSDEYVGSTLKITYQWAPEIRSLQDWVESSDDRVVCADLYVKYFEPCLIDLNISYYGTGEILDMVGALQTFIENIKPTSPLQVSDITEYCYRLGASHVVEPMLLQGELHDTYGAVTHIESEDQFQLARTQIYVPRNIVCTYLGIDS